MSKPCKRQPDTTANDNLYVRRSTRKLQSTTQILSDIIHDKNTDNHKFNDTSHIIRKPSITSELRYKLSQYTPNNHIPYNLHIYYHSNKGMCVKSINHTVVQPNEFICEYGGELINRRVAGQREVSYSDTNQGCYMYYFQKSNRNYCIDATDESNQLYGIARYINHSCISPNLYPKCITDTNNNIHLCFFSLRRIEYNDELTIDYGDRNSDAVDAHPWLLT